ncbi:MAG: TonB-dependent receptor [Gammaproteobacteria bacterium]|nr:TonB-dependent receptor [Gammaproteobacteria bacterium]
MNQTFASFFVALLCGTAPLIALPASAAEGATEIAEDPSLETVVVTGSRIAYSPTDGPQPLTVVTRDDIEASGLLSIGDLIQRLPVQGSGVNRTYNNGGDGSIRVELRALGSARTLVLVNGKRWVASGEGANSSIDLNTIPMAAIERIEVLKDGASAVYGSDAIAGVVNIILRKNVEGIEFSHQTGSFAESGGGDEQTWSVLGGVTTDRSRLTIGASLTAIDALSNADRQQTAKRPDDGGSAGTPQGRFGYGGVVGGFANFTLREGEAGTDPSHFREWTSPEDRFNYNPDNYIQTPNERRNIFLNGSYALTDNISFLFDALYQNRLSDQLLAPTPLFWGFSADEGIDATNIHNPFGITFCGFSGTNNLGADCSELSEDVAIGWFGRRMVEAGGRNFLQDIETFRGGFGFEGGLGDRWNWELYWSWAQNKASSTTEGLLNTEAIRKALGPASGCTGDCVPLNIFGGQGTDANYEGDGRWSGSGSITEAMLNYITFTAHDNGGNDMKNLNAQVTGTVFDLPAGPVGMAFGYEVREESGFTSPDALIVTGATSGNASQPTNGSYDVAEFFAEIGIPLLSGAPLAESLDINVAVRHSDYSTFGRTTNGKYNVMWRPHNDFLLRVTVSDGFRAPSIPELFFGQSDSYPELQDPCDVNSPNFTGSGNMQTNANCQAHGVPDGFVQPNSQIRITVGGNPELQPEESENFSVGLVYQPGWLEGFQAEIDWFDIEISNTIASIGSQNILEQCYSDTPQYCEHVDRGAGGFVTDLRNLNTNVGALAVSGIDLALSWTGIDTDWGLFDFAWDMTRYDEWESTDALGTRFQELGYVFGSSRNNNVDLRSTAHVGWVHGPWSARWSWQYIAEGNGVANSSPSYDIDGIYDAGDEVRILDATLYNDVVASYLWERNAYSVTVAAGVDNLFDQDPPFFPESFANDFDPDYRSWSSRFWYARVKVYFN